jgi:hypothetical protein
MRPGLLDDDGGVCIFEYGRPMIHADLSEEDLREIENITQGAVPVGGLSLEGM